MSVKVNDTDPNGTISATPCVQYYGVDGTACGLTLSTGTQFVGAATLSTGTIQVWTTYYPDFAFIYVNSCRDCKLYGYSVAQ